ncbi:MAG TPA: cation:proton antiporter [Pseudolabrys sp.]|jgi:Kef-type K+ transport system membrane component KefB/nucleotide-binding universal stress UspA family protein|nr:cation:proton antiporter [Pseudolabrys sp.]
MNVSRYWLWLLALAVITATPAFAAEGGKGPSEAIFIGEIVVLMLVGRMLGEAMVRLRQPAVMGQLIAGLLLGPSFFGLLFPDAQHALFPKSPEQKAMIDGISQFGILLLLLLTGMETDLKLVRQTGRASVFASLMGIVIPFICGVGLGEMLPDSLLPDPGKRLITSLFLGTALSIASVKIVAMVVREMNFMRRVVGQVILASAIIDDSVGWIIVSIIFSLALHGSIEPISLAQSVLGTILFMVASLTIGRRMVFFAIRWVNDNFVSEYAVVTAILIIMGVMSLITYLIGVHTVLGAFVAGVLIGESPILTRHIDEQLRGLITAFFAPVFFGIAGLTADLTILADPKIALFTAGLVLVASIGKFTGAFIGAELGGLTRREGFALACGMNARGSTEVIIATVGLSMGALSQDLFTMIVAMAVLTTTAMPPTLRWALGRIPMRKEEKQRLEREELEERGFVPNLERLLIAVDDSPNGKFASRVAGTLAGTHGMPATVLHIPDPSKIESTMPDNEDKLGAAPKGPDKKSDEETEQPRPENGKKSDKKNGNGKKKAAQEEVKAEEVGEAVQQAAAQTTSKQKKEEKVDAPVEVTTIVHEQPSPALIAEEAEKGYDVFIIGLGQTSKQNKEFDKGVTNLAKGFDGPLIISSVRDDLSKKPEGKFDILIPVNGTEPSRRAAEVALTLARATNAQVTVLYVAVRADARRGARRGIRTRRHEEAILKDIVAIADGYNMSIRTAVVAERAAEEAILRELDRRKHNLVVMGVSRRPGEKLFFGDTAAALLEKSERSLLFVAS